MSTVKHEVIYAWQELSIEPHPGIGCVTLQDLRDLIAEADFWGTPADADVIGVADTEGAFEILDLGLRWPA